MEPGSGAWGKRLCASASKRHLEARLEHQPVRRRRRPKADAHIQLEVVTQVQVHPGVKLVHLIAARQRTAEQPRLAVILDAQPDTLADRHADAATRLQLPLPFAARAAECPLDHRVQLQLHASDSLFENRPYLQSGGSLVIDSR